MKIINITKDNANMIAPLVAEFRATLNALRNICSKPDIAAAKEEAEDLIKRGYPAFCAVEGGTAEGYMVCRIDEPCLWVEHIYVREEFRRKGVASALFAKAEELARSMGEDTVFNFVHPNNEAMISFLRSKGYTVLNMLEIRKPYKGENPAARVQVDGNVFDY
ncbi:MAG: GNAT family N-acetyltransferase [Clostridia bacterium]|nr:GNAT family N-acetyltransferase [Clostridia bacterium]